MMFGLCHELMGEWGFGWCRRLLILRENLGDADEPPEPMRAAMGRMLRDYGFRPAAVKDAPPRVAEILRMLSLRLASQRAAGHRFLMGARVSALDIHWAAMAALVAPLPEEVCAMPAMVRDLYGRLPEQARAALDPALLEHRDAIYRDFMELPVRL